MSMHLEGPWLSTTGKRKGKPKFKNSEEARKARDLEESWNSLQKKWGVEQEEKKRQRALKSPPLQNYLRVPVGRETKHIPSLNGGVDMSPAALKPAPVYTGTRLKGIGVMHKSNLVPIFSDDEAVEISRMRR